MTMPNPPRAEPSPVTADVPALGREADWLVPDWPMPSGVRAIVTTRTLPGHSAPPFDAFNLGLNTDDERGSVLANRAALSAALGLASPPRFLRQVHGVAVHRVADADSPEPAIEADVMVTTLPSQALAILTADCLPVLFASEDGAVIGAAHAGWRGLAAGVLEAAVAALGCRPGHVKAWLGPCIGLASYEVGDEVRAAFVESDPAAIDAFAAGRPGHWYCDLAGLARHRLASLGLRSIDGGGYDTLTDRRFYSYRRDGAGSGRFASLIWRE